MLRLAFVLVLILWPQVAGAQTWPARVQEIVDLLAARHPDLTDRTSDDKRRELTRLFAEQAEFEFNNFGTKRYGTGPPSADSLCMRSPFVCWDWSLPSGIARFPEGLNLSGDPNQIFIPARAVNHLGVRDPPDPPTDDDDLKVLMILLSEHEAQTRAGVDSLRIQLAAVQVEVHATAESLEAHRVEVRQARGWVRRWVLERIGPVVGAAIAGWFVK